MTSISAPRSRSMMNPAGNQAHNSWLRSLLSRLRQMSKAQSIALISALVAVMMGGGAWITYRSAHQPVELMTTKLDPQDCREIASLLLRNGVDHQVSPNEDSLTVAPKDRSQARFLVARARLPHRTAKIGPESPMRGSSAEERNRRHRMVEQDLAQTLSQFSGVTEVDVKIAMPEEQSPFGDPIPVTAAVVVHLEPGKQLEPEQVSAIANFVAASVPQLQEKQVKVVDAGTGRELTVDRSPESEKSLAAHKMCALEIQKAENLREKSQRQLDRVLGPGRSSVEVDVLYDASEQESNVHTPGVIAPQLIGEAWNRERMDTQGDDKTKGYDKDTGSRKWEPSKSDTHTVNRQPRLQRVTVSVAFDNFPASRVKELSGLVEGAVGLDESRGDHLTISNVPFARTSPLVAEHRPRKEPAAPFQGSDFTALALASLAAGLLIIPAGLMWFHGRSRGSLAKNTSTSCPTTTSTDLADLLLDKKGTRMDQTSVATRPQSTEQVEKMAPRDVAAELRSQWLKDR